MNDRVLEIINDIRIRKGENALESIDPSQNLNKDLGLQSLELAEITVRIEDEFGIDIFENGIVSTVGEIYARLG